MISLTSKYITSYSTQQKKEAAIIVKTVMEHDHMLEGLTSGMKNFHVCSSEAVRINVNKCDLRHNGCQGCQSISA